MENSDLMKTDKVNVDLGSRSYPIFIGYGILPIIDYENFIKLNKVVVITNQKVAPLYLEKIESILKRKKKEYFSIVIADGEDQKSVKTLEMILTKMLKNKVERSTTILALGGGVIGDMAGFAAAIYQRGINFIQVPTTLLAQVDSSVGGKTAVNHSLGKNMIGAFHQPKCVVIDIETLDSLPRRELIAGFAEIIKYGCITDVNFFEWLEVNVDNLKRKSKDHMVYAIKKSCEIKAKIVNEDEKENGKRAILNFGHTFGHAIETSLGYGVWLHGEAIGCGMIMASLLSYKLGLIDHEKFIRIRNLIKKFELPIKFPNLQIDKFVELMSNDKKVKNNLIHYVLLEDIGKSNLLPLDKSSVKTFVNEMMR